MDPHGLPVCALVEACGVSLATAQRWKRLRQIPPLAARLVALYLNGDLGQLAPQWSGFVIRKSRMWTPHGFFVRPGEICALPYRFAQIRALELELLTPMQRSLF